MKPELLHSLKTYKKTDILRDMLAGLMVAIVALPLSIALGIQSVPDKINGVATHAIQMGLVTAIIAGFFISALGGSRFQIGGPTAAFVAILFGYLSDPEIGLIGLAVAGVSAGILLIIMGLCRVGVVMKFFPYPIIIGFTTGIGITLMLGQIKDFCGFTASGSEVIEKLISYAQNITTFHYQTFIVGVVGLAVVFLVPKINKKIPAALVALAVCTALCALLNSTCNAGIATIGSKYGDIEAGFFLPDFSKIANVNFGKLVLPSVVIAFLCAIESLLSASVAAGMTRTTVDSNQELVGQGIANIFSSLLGGLPATGAIARTVTNIENGAKSPIAGMFHAAFVLVMYFALMSVVKYIPLAVFAAILIRIAISMSRFKLFAKLVKFGWRDVSTLVVSCILTVLLDLTYGVLGGIVVACLANIKNFRTKLIIDDAQSDGTINVSGTLYFINIGKLIDKLEKALESCDKLTINMKNVSRIDQTALEKLAKLDRKIKAGGKILDFSECNDIVRYRMETYLSVL